MSLSFIVKKFDELTTLELHDIYKLRSEVFVLEQDCVYLDIDGKDPKALHVIGLLNNEIIGYTRCFEPGFYFESAAIGRVVIAKKFRKSGYGINLMEASKKAILTYYQTKNIQISAQYHLLNFYQSIGFQPFGETYLEDNIIHIAMKTKD